MNPNGDETMSINVDADLRRTMPRPRRNFVRMLEESLVDQMQMEGDAGASKASQRLQHEGRNNREDTKGAEHSHFSASSRFNPYARRSGHALSLRMIALGAVCVGLVIALAVGFVPRPMESASLVQIENSLLPATLERITADNVDRLEVVATLGEGVLYDAAWSPDGTTIAAAGARGVWLMDADNPMRSDLIPFDGGLGGFYYSADGTRVYAIGEDRAIRVIDAAARRIVGSIAMPEVPFAFWAGILWLGEEGLIMTMIGTGDEVDPANPTASLWRYDFASETWREIASPLIMPYPVAISDDGRYAVYTAGLDGRVPQSLVIADLRTGETRTLNDQLRSAQATAFSPDGETLYVGNSEGIMRWDTASGELQSTLRFSQVRPFYIRSLTASPDGRWLLAGGGFGTELVLFDLETATVVYERAGDGGFSGLVRVVARPDSQQWLIVESSGVEILDITGERFVKTTTHQNGLMALAIEPAGDAVAALEYDTAPRLWDLHTGDDRLLDRTLTDEDARFADGSITFSPDGGMLLTQSSLLTTLVDVATGDIRWQQTTDSNEGSRGVAPAFFADDSEVLFFNDGTRRIDVLDATTGELHRRIDLDQVLLTGASDGERIVVGMTIPAFASQGSQVAWLDEGEEVPETLVLADRRVDQIVFSANSRWLAIAASERDGERWEDQQVAIILWNTETTEQRRIDIPADESGGEAHDLAVTDDGALVIALSYQRGTLRAWDTRTGTLLYTLDRGWVNPNMVAFSRDERLLITGGYDGLLRVWGVRG